MLCRLPLTQIVQFIRERRISPVEVLESYLQQIERVNPSLNAFVRVLGEEAQETARAAESAVMRGDNLGPLHGAPVTVKDSFDTRGLPTYCGSRLRLQHRATADSTAASRFRAAGAVILGKTNTPEFLNMYETDNAITGRTNNPWNLELTAGGSSGGESAAIAAFCSAGGIGSDGGGSIRIPAHFCGIAGLKPTPGRVPATGHFPAIGHPGGLLGVGGPMARTAADVRLLFQTLAGHDDQDPFSAPVPLRVPSGERPRLGFWFQDGQVDQDARSAVSKALTACRDVGWHADEFEVRGVEPAHELWWLFFERLSAPLTQAMIAGREDEIHWSGTELMYQALADPPVSTRDLLTALAARDRMRSAILRQMDEAQISAIVLPVCATAAFPHRQRTFPIGNGSTVNLLEAMKPVTIWNLVGMPGIVIPFSLSRAGLPVGIQVVGRPWEEETILDIAVRLEEARGAFPAPSGF